MSRSRKDPHPKDEISACGGGGGGEKNLFPIIVNVLGHPKGIGVLTSNFLRGGGMGAFWNDPREFQYLDSNLAFISQCLDRSDFDRSF